jgi:hypothetical protein
MGSSGARLVRRPGRTRLALLLTLPLIGAVARSTVDAADDDVRFERRRPGSGTETAPKEPATDSASPTEAPEPLAPAASYLPAPPFVPIPDRWRIVEELGVESRWWDPYNRNPAKADRPFAPGEWFVNVGFVSDTVYEARRLPVGRGSQGTGGAGDLDPFGDGDQMLVNQNFVAEVALIKGDTTFRPPDWELRAVGVGNVNYLDVQEVGVVSVNPEAGTTRTDGHFGFQELFVDKHLRNVSAAYDFDSLRVGIQDFLTDVRGFLYEDGQPGLRLFGTRASNRLQYNLAWFRRLEKNTNSGLNTVFEVRADDIIAANLFYQDFLVRGFTASTVAVYNRNREGDRAPHYNDNGFIERPASVGDERPHNYDVGYLGAGGDGHVGRFNVTTNAFLAVGRDDHNPIAQRAVDIRAYLLAMEGSVDFDWYRLKLYGYHASGDDDPFDSTAGGFDAIFENPNFAGAETSLWQRQAIPLVAGGGVVLSARNALLPALRSSKEEGQSSFVNPGLYLFGVGGDFDLLPELRLTFHGSRLDFAHTEVLRTLREQRSVDREIGYDLSAAVLWRPLFAENVILRASGAVLVPGDGFNDLYDDRYDLLYSTLVSLLLTY